MAETIGKWRRRFAERRLDGLDDEPRSGAPRSIDDTRIEAVIVLVMDNYATHKTALIRNWLAKRPRWQMHLTPTSASWLNQVERFSPSSQNARSGAAYTAASSPCAPTSWRSSNATTPIRNHSAGQNPTTTYSLQSSASAAATALPNNVHANFWFSTLAEIAARADRNQPAVLAGDRRFGRSGRD